MSDEVKTPEAKAEETSSYETPSLDSVLNKVQGKESPELETESVAPEVVAEPEVATEVPAAETPAVDAQPELEAEAETPVGRPPKGYAPIQALQSEREKRQALEAQLQTALFLAQQNAHQPAPVEQQWQPPVEPDPNTVIKNQVVAMSERIARQSYPDYDEKFGAFSKALQTNPGKYQPLYESIMGSEFPAEAAYRAGEQILLAEKYGADVVGNPSKFREAIRKEIEAELKPKIEAEAHKKIQGKLTERSKTPTDISGVRAAGGTTIAEYKQPSLAQVLAKVQKRKK